MVGGIRYEFTHRVIATCVGLLTIGLAAWLWRAEKRAWMRWLGLAALGGVIAQGILGGMTVRMFQPPPVSAAHATLAQLFFSTVVAIAVFTSSWWNGALAEIDDPGSPRVRTLVVWTLAAVFLQLILGAAFRHKGFGIIPHLIGAVIVTILIFMTAGALKRRFADVPALRSCARYLHILIGVQLLLGAGRVLVPALQRALPAADRGNGGPDGRAHGDGRAGAGRDAGDSFGQLSYAQGGHCRRGFRAGFRAGCPLRGIEQ